MSDEEDATDPSKSSKRNRLKGAIARTTTKLTKRSKENATTVDDFLASGRTSTSIHRPSTSESLSYGPERLEISQPYQQNGEDALHPAESIPPPQPSPRRIVVPKIDVLSSQRYPGAQPLEPQSTEHSGSSLLRPDYRARASSLAKGHGRARGLSVQFTDRPPIIIGEGGDEAEAPTIEVGRAKARARSVSPPRTGGSPNKGIGRLWNKSPLQHIPRAGTSSPKQAPYNSSRPAQQGPSPGPGAREPGGIPSPGIKRVPTGAIGAGPSPISESRQAADKEFEMSMGISPATTSSPAPSSAASNEPAIIHAPKPIHPPVAVPHVKDIPALHELKRENGTQSLRNKFHAGEGNALREARQAESPVSPLDSSDDQVSPPPGPPPPQSALSDAVAPYSQPASAHQLPPPYERPPDPPVQRRLVRDDFPPPPGPPPGRKPLNNHILPPAGAPPAIPHRPKHEHFMPPPGPPPVRRAVHEDLGQSTKAPQPAGPPPPAFQRNPDDEYMGWVPDDVDQKQAQATSFPGVDASGKLAALTDGEEKADSKPGKLRKKWFRKGA